MTRPTRPLDLRRKFRGDTNATGAPSLLATETRLHWQFLWRENLQFTKKKLFLATSKATIAKQSTIPHSLKINSAKRSANYSVACISSCRIALQSISVESNIVKSVQNLEYLHEIYQHFASPWLTTLKILLYSEFWNSDGLSLLD